VRILARILAKIARLPKKILSRILARILQKDPRKDLEDPSHLQSKAGEFVSMAKIDHCQKWL
jgi:hypothetical protein